MLCLDQSELLHMSSNVIKSAPTFHTGVAWHHVRALVPSDWEVTAYSVEDRAGRLEFGTRAGLVALVSWETCERVPDRTTTMLTFLQNNVLGKERGNRLALEEFKTASIGRFEMGWLENGGPCQALAYAATARKLIRWVFEERSRGGRPWRTAVEPILESCDFNAERLAEYNLHGIHVHLPRSYAIEDIVTLPANVMMSFENGESKRRATFRRWGLPTMLLGEESLAAFHARILRTVGGEVKRSERCLVNGMEACRSFYSGPREHHMDRFMGRRWHNGVALIWHDRQSQRLHTFEQIGPDGSDELDPGATLPGFKLTLEPDGN